MAKEGERGKGSVVRATPQRSPDDPRLCLLSATSPNSDADSAAGVAKNVVGILELATAGHSQRKGP